MRTHVFLTPMSADGTPGEVKEISYNEERAQFLEPLPYWSVNDADLAKLRAAVSDAETALRHAKSKKASDAEITKLETAVVSAKRELDIVQYELRRQRQRQQIGADSPFSRNAAEPPSTTAQFAEPVAYFAAPLSEEVKQLRAKVAEAVKSLGELRASGASATSIMRAEETLRSLKEELASLEFGKPTGTRDQAPRLDPPRAIPPLKSTVGKNTQSLAEMVASVTAGVAALPTRVAKKTTVAWDNYLRDFDSKQAKRALDQLLRGETTAVTAAHGENICCSGQYLCPKCRAKAPA